MIKLLILGDIGHFDKNLIQTISVCKKRTSNKCKTILLGDNFYPYGVSDIHDNQWKNFQYLFKDFDKNHIHSILGNHDYIKNPLCQVNTFYWNTPDFFYKINLSDYVDLYFLDTVQLFEGHCGITKNIIQTVHSNHINNLINNQINWFTKELQNNNNKRKIVFGHYPIITNGVYSFHMTPLFNLLMPIFKKYDIDAYISGHEHNAQYLTRNYDNYTFRQFIVGSSGQSRTGEFINKQSFFNSNSDMYDNTNNYMIEFVNNGPSIIINFISKDNEIIYSYNI
jgi:tartrate-resistant acid phosphatase type 5